MTIKSTIEGNYYLINNDSNNGVRVNKTSGRTWTIAQILNLTAFSLKDNEYNRYCASYAAQSDWRSYDSYNAGNYGDGGKIYLYKKIDFRGDAPISWSAATGNVTLTENGPSMTLPTLTNTQNLSIAYASNNESVATIANDGTITAISSGTAVISATFDGSNISEQYKTTTVTYTLSVIDNRPTVATPTITPASGEVSSGTTVSISCTTSGATIYYTTGNSDFTAGDWIAYSAPITITEACTLKAIATKSNYKNSAEASAEYTILGGLSNGTLLFNCDFGTTATALANYSGGTSYNNASTITYSASNPDKVKIDANSATNMTGGNLFFNGKSNAAGYTATIAGIKTYGATKVTVVWAANNNSSDLKITQSSTSKVTSANSANNRAVFTLSGTETTISLVFSNNAATNTRIDNVFVYYGEVNN